MTGLQTSAVFSQRDWPAHDPDPDDGTADLDDCWVIAALQLVHAAAPWVRLPNVRRARRAAGDPDDGHRDGGRPVETMRLLRGLYPQLAPFCRRLDARPLDEVWAALDAGRPVSAAIIAGKLPKRLQHGYAGAHQVTIARDPDLGAWAVVLADPLAPPHSRWKAAGWPALMPALEAYAGRGRATVIAGPTAAEALTVHPLADLAVASAAFAAGRLAALGEATAAIEKLREGG